jgi:hypothetical protein
MRSRWSSPFTSATVTSHSVAEVAVAASRQKAPVQDEIEFVVAVQVGDAEQPQRVADKSPGLENAISGADEDGHGAEAGGDQIRNLVVIEVGDEQRFAARRAVVEYAREGSVAAGDEHAQRVGVRSDEVEVVVRVEIGSSDQMRIVLGVEVDAVAEDAFAVAEQDARRGIGRVGAG